MKKVHKLNIHNHTKFSDGYFEIEKIIMAAKECLDVVGISDHYETTKVNSVPRKNLEKYIMEVKRYDKEFGIRVLVGIEVDFSSRTQIEYLPESFSKLDYALFEYVNDFDNGGYPLSKLLSLRKKIPTYIGLAHTDILTSFRDMDYDVVLSILEHNDIFIELNTSILYTKLGEPYYRIAEEFFSRVGEYEVGIAVGTDTHTSLVRVCEIDDAYNFIREKNLEENLEVFIRKIRL